MERKKGEVQVSPTIAHQNAAPYDVQSSKSSWTWMKISAKDSAIISDRIELVNGVKNLLQDLPNAEPGSDPLVWGDYQAKVFFERLLAVGIDRLETIMNDERLPFKVILKNDRQMLPDYTHDVESLMSFVCNGQSRSGPPPKELVFVMPTTKKIRFRNGKESSTKRGSASYGSSYSAGEKKKRINVYDDSSESDSDQGESFFM